MYITIQNKVRKNSCSSCRSTFKKTLEHNSFQFSGVKIVTFKLFRVLRFSLVSRTFKKCKEAFREYSFTGTDKKSILKRKKGDENRISFSKIGRTREEKKRLDEFVWNMKNKRKTKAHVRWQIMMDHIALFFVSEDIICLLHYSVHITIISNCYSPSH